tara:strand:+ start:35 stop:313 length:279 start_codon:yes stop_codon:yes gene_type:complete
MSESNGDLINKRISNFRIELESKYPKLKGTIELNCALDLSRLVLSTFTRDAQNRLSSLEKQLSDIQKMFKYILSLVTALIITLLSNVIFKLL